MPHTPLSHTADTGVEAIAATFPDLVAELAVGMFEVMAPVEPCPSARELTTTISAKSREEMVVDCLSELLYLAETEDLHFCGFDIEESGASSVVMRARGVPITAVELTGPTVKAVTYHLLEVSRARDGWYGRVYFDV